MGGGRSITGQVHLQRLVAIATVAALMAACVGPVITERPVLSVAPRATVRITERPTAPPGLVISGADAPRNIPDPCALLTAAELEELMGVVPEIAVRGFVTDDDSWTCLVQAVSGDSAQVAVALYVNAAYLGWDQDLLLDAGTKAVSDPGVIGAVFGDGSVAVELGQDVVVVATSRTDGSATDPDVVVSALASVVKRLTPTSAT